VSELQFEAVTAKQFAQAELEDQERISEVDDVFFLQIKGKFLFFLSRRFDGELGILLTLHQ
jgi:hypothetical protein